MLCVYFLLSPFVGSNFLLAYLEDYTKLSQNFALLQYPLLLFLYLTSLLTESDQGSIPDFGYYDFIFRPLLLYGNPATCLHSTIGKTWKVFRHSPGNYSMFFSISSVFLEQQKDHNLMTLTGCIVLRGEGHSHSSWYSYQSNFSLNKHQFAGSSLLYTGPLDQSFIWDPRPDDLQIEPEKNLRI